MRQKQTTTTALTTHRPQEAATPLLDAIVAPAPAPAPAIIASKATTYTISLEKQIAYANILAGKHCGGIGNGKFKYDLRVTTTSLDKDGFVIDNEVVKDVAKAWKDKTWVASCEALAGGLVGLFAVLLKDRVVSIHATVYNNTGKVHVDWHAGEPMPLVPRLATKQQLAKVAADKAKLAASQKRKRREEKRREEARRWEWQQQEEEYYRSRGC